MSIKYIAELCQNHLGKIKNVEKMVEQCAFYGAKIIKLQYILSKNLSHRPEFDFGLKNKKKLLLSKDLLKMSLKD